MYILVFQSAKSEILTCLFQQDAPVSSFTSNEQLGFPLSIIGLDLTIKYKENR